MEGGKQNFWKYKKIKKYERKKKNVKEKKNLKFEKKKKETNTSNFVCKK